MPCQLITALSGGGGRERGGREGRGTRVGGRKGRAARGGQGRAQSRAVTFFTSSSTSVSSRYSTVCCTIGLPLLLRTVQYHLQCHWGPCPGWVGPLRARVRPGNKKGRGCPPGGVLGHLQFGRVKRGRVAFVELGPYAVLVAFRSTHWTNASPGVSHL